MVAIIRKQTDKGLEMETVDNVLVVKHIIGFEEGERNEALQLWVSSAYPYKTVVLDETTDIVFKYGGNT